MENTKDQLFCFSIVAILSLEIVSLQSPRKTILKFGRKRSSTILFLLKKNCLKTSNTYLLNFMFPQTMNKLLNNNKHKNLSNLYSDYKDLLNLLDIPAKLLVHLSHQTNIL